MNALMRRPSQVNRQDVEAAGFHHGVHGVSSDQFLGKLQERFQQQAEAVHQHAVGRIKPREARAATLERRLQEADQRWRSLENETCGRPPDLVGPGLALVAALAAAGSEVILLAPVMDGFDIADPTTQLWAAAGVTIVASGLIHAVLHMMNTDGKLRTWLRVGLCLLTGFALCFVTVLGWWRAEQMIHVANLNNEELAAFVTRNELLTKLVVTFAAMAFPIFTGIFSEWGLSRFLNALHWQGAKRRYEALDRKRERTQREIDALNARRDRAVAILQHQARELEQVYSEKHALGQRIGARRQPLWHPLIKIAAVALLLGAVCGLADSWFTERFGPRAIWFQMALAAGLGIAYAAYALRAWHQPTPRELVRQQRTIWREGGSVAVCAYPSPAEPVVEAEPDEDVIDAEALPPTRKASRRRRAS
jgi:hypothetical protein